ncbi:MAG: Lacal_2735 family protein [Bacteroidota bacterium]
MFGLFKKKSEVEKLQEKYQKLMKEAFDLSKSNRSASDDKYAEADAVQKRIEALENKLSNSNEI